MGSNEVSYRTFYVSRLTCSFLCLFVGYVYHDLRGVSWHEACKEYEFLEHLGGGAFGKMRNAMSKVDGNVRAVKRIDISTFTNRPAETKAITDRLETEVRIILAMERHVNVCELKEVLFQANHVCECNVRPQFTSILIPFTDQTLFVCMYPAATCSGTSRSNPLDG